MQYKNDDETFKFDDRNKNNTKHKVKIWKTLPANSSDDMYRNNEELVDVDIHLCNAVNVLEIKNQHTRIHKKNRRVEKHLLELPGEFIKTYIMSYLNDVELYKICTIGSKILNTLIYY